MQNQDRERIKRVSKCFRWLFTMLAVAMPLVAFAYWMAFNHVPQEFIPLPAEAMVELPVATRLYGFIVSMLPVGVAIAAMHVLSRLFRLYEQGIVFSTTTVKYYRHLGIIIMLWVLASFLYLPMLSHVLTYLNPPDHRVIVAQFGMSDLAALLMGGVIILISWVMDEARKLEEEQAQTI